jgi:hypothetical protein
MKTAIQELQEWMTENHFKVTFAFLDQLEYCKQKEKEQIIDAYYGGVKLLSGDIETAAKHYYYQTYKQNKLFTYCQREIEGQSICDKQCEHCKEYYAPLENQNK